jgi:hypothetical protein
MYPFKQLIKDNVLVRTFDVNISESELIWHKDKLDRIIKVISGRNWQLQIDNELPETLIIGKEYHIPKETYHRLIKGIDKLVINIYE